MAFQIALQDEATEATAEYWRVASVVFNTEKGTAMVTVGAWSDLATRTEAGTQQPAIVRRFYVPNALAVIAPADFAQLRANIYAHLAKVWGGGAFNEGSGFFEQMRTIQGIKCGHHKAGMVGLDVVEYEGTVTVASFATAGAASPVGTGAPVIISGSDLNVALPIDLYGRIAGALYPWLKTAQCVSGGAPFVDADDV